MKRLIHEADASGGLDCGCVISYLSCAAPPPQLRISMCPTHRGAQPMRMALNLLRGFTAGAPAVFTGNNPDARRARQKFKTAHEIICKVMSEIDPACIVGCVRTPGPGKERI